MQRAACRVWVPVALIAAAVPFVVTARGTENPAAAVAAAAGHPAGRRLHAESSRIRDGQPVRWTLDVDGETRLERSCTGALCSGTWFDGTHSYAFGINGTPYPERDRDDDTERTLASIASTAFAEPAYLRSGGRVTALAREADGALRYQVRSAGGAELVAIVDPATQRVTSVDRLDGTALEALVASGTAPTVVFAAEHFDAVTAAVGAIGAPTGPVVHVAEPGELPLLPGPLPIVPCRLGGRDARCLIDTGTTPSAVTLDFAEKLGREPHDTIAVDGLGSYLTGVIEADPLELGGTSLLGLHLAVVPHAAGPNFDVIVGSDALAGMRIGFEPARRRATITADAPTSASTGIALSFAGGLPFADAALGSRPAQAMLLDTGDSATLSIGYDAYRESPGLFAPRGNSRATGVGGVTMDAIDGRLDRSQIGSLPLADVPISAVRGQHTGHLGYGLAARCGRLTIALGERRIACAAADSRGAGQR